MLKSAVFLFISLFVLSGCYGSNKIDRGLKSPCVLTHII